VDEVISGLTGLFFQNCDGAVAIEAVGFQKARELQQLIRTQGVNSMYTAPATVHENLDAPSGGNKSLYKVTWRRAKRIFLRSPHARFFCREPDRLKVTIGPCLSLLGHGPIGCLMSGVTEGSCGR
jgi:hypothetical protein